jgi:choline dehydrogenase-like flavoprotein
LEIMIIDLRQGDFDELRADIAIVGAGAAGVTLARSLIESGRTVLLLESGGLDHETATSDFNRGISVGQPYYELEESRLRFFGGATAVWGGRCAELDPIDFERRDWVPWSGWPISKQDLAPWYLAARRMLDLPDEDPKSNHQLLEQMDGRSFCIRKWLIDTSFDRFGAKRNADLLKNPRLQVALHATVREILVSDNAAEVTGLDVRRPYGGRTVARAKQYVLAAGGLENPRVLLASNSVVPAGLGNAHDLVGRFFMEHPHARGGRLHPRLPWAMIEAFRKRSLNHFEVAPLLAPSRDLQKRREILNSALTVAVRPPAGGAHPLVTRVYLTAKNKMRPTTRGRSLWKGYRRLGRQVRESTGPLFWWGRQRFGSAEFALVFRAEQSPNPDSRVTLLRQTDGSGMPRIKLDWQLSELDKYSAAVLVEEFAAEASSLNLGEVDIAQWLRNAHIGWDTDPLVSVHPLGGYHHMGTTRMAESADRGVTDGWGKVHGIANLYIAGSSLFPTGGWANPTLSIIALALRTAERLAEKTR